MKRKLLALVLLVLLCGSKQAFSQYPIPSYNVNVTSWANFQEPQLSSEVSIQKSSNSDYVISPMAKRDMNVQVNCCGFSSCDSCQATVWVYSLDGQTILGPFTVYGGDVLSVPIDDRDWGVIVSTEDDITVDVWIGSDDMKKPVKLNKKEYILRK
jgi:hypothetical protein